MVRLLDGSEEGIRLVEFTADGKQLATDGVQSSYIRFLVLSADELIDIAESRLGMGIYLIPKLQFVIPAKAGIHSSKKIDAYLRRHDNFRILFNPYSLTRSLTEEGCQEYLHMDSYPVE